MSMRMCSRLTYTLPFIYCMLLLPPWVEVTCMSAEKGIRLGGACATINCSNRAENRITANVRVRKVGLLQRV